MGCSATLGGRLFLGSNNGHLYELQHSKGHPSMRLVRDVSAYSHSHALGGSGVLEVLGGLRLASDMHLGRLYWRWADLHHISLVSHTVAAAVPPHAGGQHRRPNMLTSA